MSSLRLPLDSAGVAQIPKRTPNVVLSELGKLSRCREGKSEARSAKVGDFDGIDEIRRGLLQLQDDEVCEGATCAVFRLRSDKTTSVRPDTAVYPSQRTVEGAQLLRGLVLKDNQLLDSLGEASELAGEHRALVQEPLQVRRSLAHGRGS